MYDCTCQKKVQFVFSWSYTIQTAFGEDLIIKLHPSRKYVASVCKKKKKTTRIIFLQKYQTNVPVKSELKLDRSVRRVDVTPCCNTVSYFDRREMRSSKKKKKKLYSEKRPKGNPRKIAATVSTAMKQYGTRVACDAQSSTGITDSGEGSPNRRRRRHPLPSR